LGGKLTADSRHLVLPPVHAIITFQLNFFGDKNVPKSAKIEKPEIKADSFVEAVSKKGTPVNGLRINFGFTRRKRKSGK
jgi:hypothetical protein